ncbi:MAG: heavy metal translocating P-type ATPase, partial [Hyphomicrobiaceae bacterium]
MAKIEDGLEALPFVMSARANLSTKRVSVTWDTSRGRATAISERLSRLGFDHLAENEKTSTDVGDRIGKRLLVSVGVAGFAAANIMLLSVSVWSGADDATRQLFHLISGLIAVPTVAFAGRPFFSSALGALRHKQLNMDVPISLAVLLAVGMSIVESIRGGPHAYFDASVMLLFFLLIGRYLDHVMRERARGAVKQLSALASKGATVIQADGQMQYVHLADIFEGLRISVAAGERVPVDGIVISGRSDVDRSFVTGESEAQLISPGDPVEGGTLNLTAPLEIRATRTADRSFLAEVTQMMEAAEQGKSRFVRIADRFARIYA